ncbi:MAG: bifunctional diaminohydroxyphosphoribosylaminopyrimidine deaminase/5-amino-6-(5-phosphoribosylamino)uracil reductase RibD [Elusimicrobiota bacterium]|nr:bifunctional diaminohydroxyphosphoribosylaminopyrimidine deaminase/5-amino-6-(5-phosphoribosylamino)uracil reductase RibD [Elusimicrobiota bacterium]
MNTKFMKLAIELAKKGKGKVSPNPLVGCVIVKNNKVIAKGWHKYFGANHAEVEALLSAGQNAQGADLYCTLEPCNSFGKKPPCSQAIVKSKIKRVFFAVKDKAVKESVNFMKVNNIEVVGGILEKEAKNLLKDYLIHLKKEPEVCIKTAISLDGKIATYKYDSKWISSKKARNYVHKLRGQYDAVLIGTNTALKDNPFLTTHSKTLQNPVRVVIDSNLNLPKKAHLLDGSVSTVVLYDQTLKKISNHFIKDGIILTPIDIKAAKKNFNVIIEKLNKFSLKRILIEGGGEIISSALFSKSVDKIYFFYSPKIIGGKTAVSVVGGQGVENIVDALKVKNLEISKFGKDFLVVGNLKKE